MSANLGYERWKKVLSGRALPAAVVDLDALDHNIEVVKKAVTATEVTVRVATKSIRHVGLTQYVLEHGGPGFAGLMAFS
ncbi:MAG: hypothetical protein KC561_11395, partial [Myxococcales bacterium]|nr:hypothetical protein [Myxococcales bacterium]